MADRSKTCFSLEILRPALDHLDSFSRTDAFANLTTGTALGYFVIPAGSQPFGNIDPRFDEGVPYCCLFGTNVLHQLRLYLTKTRHFYTTPNIGNMYVSAICTSTKLIIAKGTMNFQAARTIWSILHRAKTVRILLRTIITSADLNMNTRV